MKHTLKFISSLSLLFSMFLGYAQDVPEISKNLKDTVATKKPKTETVKIKFRDWAASYVLAQPLHHSQKVVKNFYKVRLGEREVDEIIISIETRLSSRLDYNKNKRTILERSNELAFLLGRFREYAEIIEDNN